MNLTIQFHGNTVEDGEERSDIETAMIYGIQNKTTSQHVDIIILHSVPDIGNMLLKKKEKTPTGKNSRVDGMGE